MINLAVRAEKEGTWGWGAREGWSMDPKSCCCCCYAKSLQSCPTPWDPIDSSPPGSSVPGILQARRLEWVPISFSNAWMHAKLPQSCPSLCNAMDSSPPGSSVHRILQARILEWAAISFSRSHDGILIHLVGAIFKNRSSCIHILNEEN